MTDATIMTPESEADARPAWGGVLSMTLGVFALVGAEFLPASLLTPMAADLGISEGMAGQAVTATAAVALLTSLLVTVVTRRLDRRLVLRLCSQKWPGCAHRSVRRSTGYGAAFKFFDR